MSESEGEEDIFLEPTWDDEVDIEMETSWQNKMYISHFLSAWGERMWGFANIIFIVDVFNDSLLPLAIGGFTETSVSVFLGGFVGSWVDKYPRLYIMQTSLLIQNFAIAISSVIFYVLLVYQHDISVTMRWFMFIITLLLGGVARLCMSVGTISVEKDWVVVACEGKPDMLSHVNSKMRGIDLVCKLAAPILVGLFAVVVQVKAAVIIIAIWNGISLFFEYNLITIVYKMIPKLSMAKDHDTNENEDHTHSTSIFGAIANYYHTTKNGYKQYIKSSIFLPSLAYTFMYLNVFEFGGVMTAYCLWTGAVDQLGIAIARGGGAFFGLLATFIIPKWIKRLGLDKTGMVTYMLFAACMILCLLSFASGFSSSKSVWFLITGAILSRFGLWGYDLVETQIMQERVNPAHAGIINGTQRSLCNVLLLSSYIVTMIFPKPEDYVYPSVISTCGIIFSLCIYTVYYLRTTKQLEQDNIPISTPTSLDFDDERFSLDIDDIELDEMDEDGL